jgi:hypothetical protein
MQFVTTEPSEKTGHGLLSAVLQGYFRVHIHESASPSPQSFSTGSMRQAACNAVVKGIVRFYSWYFAVPGQYGYFPRTLCIQYRPQYLPGKLRSVLVITEQT